MYCLALTIQDGELCPGLRSAERTVAHSHHYFKVPHLPHPAADPSILTCKYLLLLADVGSHPPISSRADQPALRRVTHMICVMHEQGRFISPVLLPLIMYYRRVGVAFKVEHAVGPVVFKTGPMGHGP